MKDDLYVTINSVIFGFFHNRYHNTNFYDSPIFNSFDSKASESFCLLIVGLKLLAIFLIR